MFLFHSCNHALTPHFHQFTVLRIVMIMFSGMTISVVSRIFDSDNMSLVDIELEDVGLSTR
jgi:hypothetical protein